MLEASRATPFRDRSRWPEGQWRGFPRRRLETVAQPIWVVDPDGVIRFANPAAITALGFDSADELLGRNSHETTHCRHPDGTPYDGVGGARPDGVAGG